MNRIILIGNGFDLAHNLKTSYSHFIVSYLKKALKESYTQNIFNDSLIVVRNNKKFSSGIVDLDSYLNGLNSVVDIFENRHIKHNLPAILGTPNVGTRTGMFIFEINSEFIKRIFAKGNLNNWVDIETEYYNFLLELIDDPRGKNKNQQIQKLNADFDFLTKRLHEYLIQIEKNADLSFTKVNNEFTEKIIQLIHPKQLDNSYHTSKIFSSLILNYNYTGTIDNYIDSTSQKYLVDKINIHGSIRPSDDFIFRRFNN